jgi:glutathione S-transferase
MIQFYGAPMSSAGRTHLMLEEVGVPYEYHRVNVRDDAAKAELLKLNPAGKIPFLIDGDVRLSESCAINFYLAEKYKPELMPADLVERAQVYMWSFWAMTNLQPDALAVMFSMMRPNESHGDITAKKAHCQRLFDHLEGALDGGYLVAGKLSVADIIAGSVVNLAQRVNAGTLGPKSIAWIDGLRAREAWKKVAAQG